MLIWITCFVFAVRPGPYGYFRTFLIALTIVPLSTSRGLVSSIVVIVLGLVDIVLVLPHQPFLLLSITASTCIKVVVVVSIFFFFLVYCLFLHPQQHERRTRPVLLLSLVVVASAAGRVCAIVVAAIVDIKKCHYPQCTGKAICNLKNAILSFFQL